MSMPGGGCHKVAPGQVTDDSELSMCLMRGLVAGNGLLDLKETCKQYANWLKSTPFDIGNTTRNGLSKCSAVQPDPAKPQAAAKKGAGQNSLSNGAMMRMGPMGVWLQNLQNVSDLESAVNQDVSFTHS